MKNKTTILMIIIMGLIALTSCSLATEETQNDKTSLHSQKELDRDEVLACVNNGGVVKKVCMKAVATCLQVYKDAGEECSSSSECMGECRTSSQVDAGSKMKGYCSADNNPCGCFQNVELGVAQPALCID